MSGAVPVEVLSSFRCEQFSVCLSDYHVDLRQTWHSHEEPIVTLLLTGFTREQVGRRDVIASPLDIGTKPAGVRHADHFWPNGVRALRIVLDSSLFYSMRELSIIMGRWNWITGSEAVRPFLRAARLLRVPGHHGQELEESVYDALAALLPNKSSQRMADAPLWLRQARNHLEGSYMAGVRLTHLAQTANVHPIYFARQFRRFFGCSVGSYVRKLQMRDTAHLLATPEVSLSQVACQVGFSDQPHMTRTFSDQLGITPGEYRRLVN